MKNPFLKYIMKDEKEDIFHSSAYGKAQNGGSMGVASSTSFNERMNINRDRQVVRGYGDSKLANQNIGNGPRAKQYTPPEKSGSIGGPRPVGVGENSKSFAPTRKMNFGK